MSVSAERPPKLRRQTLARAILVLVWFLLGTIIFITSRGHTLLVDNKDLDELEAPGLITVYIDRFWGVEYFRGDRDRVTVSGSKHRVRVKFDDGSPDFEGEFILPIKNDMYLLSIPKMIHGIKPFVEVFHAAPEPGNDREEADEDFETESPGE